MHHVWYCIEAGNTSVKPIHIERRNEAAFPLTNIHREITGVVKSITVSLRTTGKFYASILVDDGTEASAPLHTVRKVTGVELGLSHFGIESNGRKIANPRFVKRAEKNLRRKQRQLSRKTKGSVNRIRHESDNNRSGNRTKRRCAYL